MIKLLSAVAITAASILPIGEAKAASTWDAYAGQRACMYLRQGVAPEDAGYKAALDVLDTRWHLPLMRAVNQYGDDYVGQKVAIQVLQLCPEALIQAAS